ncbi:hypothetical protein HDG32_005338 [Paraburkholderia sp. CI2]|uniref:hypothetical protein n=1 Tax=Paraburkholderia sp. CI2 TaxID=2723093 RepID=UPI0016175AE1|nr:hypothetical protein [Paraburkholderia sp. CI2]MBB5469191.1 hypothetical protein [Paraburkholderia sp. CI2]
MKTLTDAVDAAMVEMKGIFPPLRRSECERLIRAALAACSGSESLPHLFGMDWSSGVDRTSVALARAREDGRLEIAFYLNGDDQPDDRKAYSLAATEPGFEEAWPDIHRAGGGHGWRGVALAAWRRATRYARSLQVKEALAAAAGASGWGAFELVLAMPDKQREAFAEAMSSGALNAKQSMFMPEEEVLTVAAMMPRDVWQTLQRIRASVPAEVLRCCSPDVDLGDEIDALFAVYSFRE